MDGYMTNDTKSIMEIVAHKRGLFQDYKKQGFPRELKLKVNSKTI